MRSRWASRLLPGIGLVALLLVVAAIWLGSTKTIYRTVTDATEDPRPGAGGNTYISPPGVIFFPPEYEIRDGVLYLRTQVQRSPGGFGWLIETEWDEAGIIAFRARHPELEAYWPDPKRADGGVRWLRR